MSNKLNDIAGIDTKVLAEALGIDIESAKKLNEQADQRGTIIRVSGDGLQIIPPKTIETDLE